jgi:hypothetical protein
LTLRAGITKVLVQRTYDSEGSPTYYDNGNGGVKFATGFGINWQNFTLDANVDVQSLENSISAVQPGRGLLFAGDIVTVTTADLRYKF